MWNEIYPWFVAAIGGAIGAWLLLPTKAGEFLIKSALDKSLEKFKADQARELERVKEKLNHLGDRGKRSNEMEFQAIEKVWRAFVRGWLSTNTCIGQMMQVPDFQRMSDDEIESLVSSSNLDEREKKSLLSAKEKQKEYTSILSWKSVNEAGNDIFNARLTLREQRIFMPADLTEEFNEALEQMSGAQVERRLSLEHPHIQDYQYGKSQMDWMNKCAPLFDRMAGRANERLFRTEKLED